MLSCFTFSAFSHVEQNCCTKTIFGTCNVDLSEYLVFCVVSKSIIRTGLYRQLTRRSSAVSCNTVELHLCSGYNYGQMAYYMGDVSASRALHTCRNIAYARIWIFCRTYLVFIETRPTSKVPFALVAGYSNIFERVRRAIHAFATRLVTDVCNVSPTHFFTFYTRTILPQHQSNSWPRDNAFRHHRKLG